jgi:hypothetical protein
LNLPASIIAPKATSYEAMIGRKLDPATFKIAFLAPFALLDGLLDAIDVSDGPLRAHRTPILPSKNASSSVSLLVLSELTTRWERIEWIVPVDDLFTGTGEILGNVIPAIWHEKIHRAESVRVRFFPTKVLEPVIR